MSEHQITDAAPDVVSYLRREAEHPVMKHTGSGEVDRWALVAAADEIEHLRAKIETIRRAWEMYPMKMMQQVIDAP